MNFDFFGLESSAPNPAVPTAEDIYQAYPRRQGKIDAIRSIQRAMKREHPSHLLERTQAFAEAVARWPAEDNPKFVPHPATWFNRGSYDDDPKLWERKAPSKGKAGFA